MLISNRIMSLKFWMAFLVTFKKQPLKPSRSAVDKVDRWIGFFERTMPQRCFILKQAFISESKSIISWLNASFLEHHLVHLLRSESIWLWDLFGGSGHRNLRAIAFVFLISYNISLAKRRNLQNSLFCVSRHRFNNIETFGFVSCASAPAFE